jgi:hypothetical protein
MENFNEVQIRWTDGFGPPTLTCVAIAWLRDTVETEETMQNVNRGRSERPRSSTNN